MVSLVFSSVVGGGDGGGGGRLVEPVNVLA